MNNMVTDNCIDCIKCDVCSLKDKYIESINKTSEFLNEICDIASISVNCNHYVKEVAKVRADLKKTFYEGTD